MATSEQAPSAERSATALVNHYLDAFYTGDFDTAGLVLADEFSFRGPFIEATGKESFLTSADGLRRIVKGHRLLRQWEDGNEVASIYELRIETPVGAGAVTMSEWHVACDGKLISALVLFDTAAFRALVPAA